MSTAHRIVAFGELMLRLTAPDKERLLQSANLKATFGGAESNVAVSLARMGHDAAVMTVLPQNTLGAAARDELRKAGVDVGSIRFTSGRIGLYFLTPGAVLTTSEVLYDRAGSAFALAEPTSYDWPALLKGADWLHISGVTPAVGPLPCQAAQAAVETAEKLDVNVCFDGNFRSKLWALWDGDPAAVWRRMLSSARLGLVNDLDIGLALGESFAGEDPIDRRRRAARRAFEVFPRLQTIASTLRETHGADACTLGAVLFTRGGEEAYAPPRGLNAMVDRIGGGDAFAAGVLHGVISGMGAQQTVEFALAASILKHAIPGDFNLSSVEDIAAMTASGGSDVRR
jgi:2-dehydro-3-deoxygluconokinase